jgi:DNA-binding transcriptional ArsR family regulator
VMLRAWPLENATPLLVAPAGSCTGCECRLSRYRSFGETACWACQAADPSDGVVVGRVVTGTAPRIVLAQLEAGPLAARDIAAQTGLTMSTVKGVLRRLRAQGIVTIGGTYKRPVYRLRGRHDEEPPG